MNLQWQERTAIFRSKYFIFGLCLRFLFLFINESSPIFQKYFIPFLDYFAQNPFANPWNHFGPEYFPYGIFPLIVLGIPKVIAYQLGGGITLGPTPFNFFFIKFILLFFDIILFWILSRFVRYNNQRLTWFYWLNPIVIYISFILGHFDVISMGLILLSLFLVGKQKFSRAGLIAGLALTAKFQVAIVLPFIAAYIWNTNYRFAAGKYLLHFFSLTFLIALIGFTPVITAQHLSYSTLTSPEAQRLLAAQIDMGSQVHFLIGIALIALALGRLIFSTRISFMGLILGSGFLLGCLILTTHPHPAWYLWFIPFLALFYTNYVTAPILTFFALIFFYFLHFLIMNTKSSPLTSVSFTLMQVSLLVQLLMIYWLALRHESQLKNRLRPMMIGLSGDSGAGKNHLSQTLQALLDPSNCIIIEGDNYHKWERGDKNWETLTHLNPSANNLLEMQAHANQIARGQPIMHHHYNHTTGKFVLQPPTNPTKSILFQGLHSLYLKSLRDILDLKIFLDPHEKVRTYWKMQRDVFERGHQPEAVLASLAKRQSDSQLHIQPQKSKSDWVIEMTTDAPFEPLSLTPSTNLPLYIRYTLFNDEPIVDILEALKLQGLITTIDFLPSDLDKVQVTIKGHINRTQIALIAEKLFPSMRHITRSAHPPQFLDGYEGVHQLFLLALLSKRMEFMV